MAFWHQLLFTKSLEKKIFYSTNIKISYSLLNDIDHHLGITFITLAFVYALYVTQKTNNALMPYMFYLLYGIGGMLIFREMQSQQKHFIYFAELAGFSIAFYLAYHSFTH